MAWPGVSNSGGRSGRQPGLILWGSNICSEDPIFLLDSAPWILGLETVIFFDILSGSGRRLDLRRNINIFLNIM